MDMLSEALRLQTVARKLLGDVDSGMLTLSNYEERTAQWAQDRKEFAAMVPHSSIDALSQLHSIAQAATALLECRESPECVEGLVSELILGLASQIKFHERLVGRTCDELSLYHGYAPPTGVH